MRLPDVNVLVYAFRGDAAAHEPVRRFFDEMVASPQPFGISELVASGFVRVVTHPKVFRTPTGLDDALGFVEAVIAQPNAIRLRPGPRHLGIFIRLCHNVGARGNLVPDAYHAALAIEHGCEWVTTDRDYARFPELRWRHPLDP